MAVHVKPAMAVHVLLVFLAAFTCGLAEVTQNTHDIADHISLSTKQGKVHFNIKNQENGALLEGELRVPFAYNSENVKECDYSTTNCLQFGPDLRLVVEKKDLCYHMNWTSSLNISIESCFNYGDDYWYGGPENHYQYWPFSNMTFQEFSYITKESGNQAIAEPYWLVSNGFYIFVDRTVPLFIDSNNHIKKGLCLIAKQDVPYLARGGTYLSYKVCTYKNVKVAHMNAVTNDLGRPGGIPDKRMVESPIWSTWVRYKADVNESAVRDFAKEILSYGFNNSQLEIDDNWETCYGSAEFNSSRFPHMPNLSADLNDMGFRVTLWTHPFINSNCPLYKTATKKGYLTKNQNGSELSIWWNGIAGVVDFTNPEAADWYVKRRTSMMKKNKIDSLKLDAGESSWYPQIPILNSSIDSQPNAGTVAYVQAVARFGNLIEVRSGYGTQDLPIFVRMLDKDSKWTFDNGLPTLITTLLQMNLNGYTFVLPDMIGGNAYDSDVVTKELFIRWLQANTFMPSIQFSAAPWDFDNETVEISKKFTSLHYQYSGQIISQMEKCVKTGTPVNSPIWWVAPKDKVAHSVWSEYMLGEDILIAPVVEKGAVARDIYLPKGEWEDQGHDDHKVYKGKQWIRNYSAPIDTLPYFIRVGNKEDDES